MAHSHAYGDPDLAEVLGGALVFEVFGSLASHGGEWAVEGACDVGNGNVLRLTVEPVAAFGAALAGDNARLAQLAQDSLEELQWDSWATAMASPLTSFLGSTW